MEPSARIPAEPTLGSMWWTSDHEISESFSRPRLPTGHRAIDEMLDGGLAYGTGGVICISAAEDSNARELAHTYMIRHLFSSPEAKATLVDSALGLDVKALYQKVVRSLHLDSSVAEQDVESNAMAALDRLKVMKVFDFEGLIEAVAEVRASVEGTAVADEQAATEPAPRGTVADSEDEGDLLEEVPLDTPPDNSTKSPQQTADTGTHQAMSSRDTVPQLLLIDDISTPTLPQLKSDYLHGQAGLMSLMRSLVNITHNHGMCTIILNGAIQQSAKFQQGKDETPSIFSSCQLKPALGNAFRWTPDLHLMVHMLPKASKDAAKVLGGKSGNEEKQELQLMNVVEVLYDRSGDGFQKWAAFVTDDEGFLKENA